MSMNDNEEREYLLTEGQSLYLCMLAAGDREHEAGGAKDICHDIVKVIMAWRRGKLLPRWEVPKLGELCKDFETPDCQTIDLCRGGQREATLIVFANGGIELQTEANGNVVTQRIIDMAEVANLGCVYGTDLIGAVRAVQEKLRRGHVVPSREGL